MALLPPGTHGEGPFGQCTLRGSARRAARTRRLRGRPKNAVLRSTHDELKNDCRIARSLGTPFGYARARAELTRRRSRASRPPRRDRRAQALPRLVVLLDVRLLRRRARLLGGRRLQSYQRGPGGTPHAGDPGGGPFGAGAPGRATRARAPPY